jgi:hypothetical protein
LRPAVPATSGLATTLTGKATEVTSGTVDGSTWSLWSADGKHGATGLEDGGLVIDGRAYGLCPGFPSRCPRPMCGSCRVCRSSRRTATVRVRLSRPRARYDLTRVSAEHNLDFGSCTTGNLVPITASQGHLATASRRAREWTIER